MEGGRCVGEYTGEILLDLDQAAAREEEYNDETTGHMSCIIHVDIGRAKFAVDATRAGSILRFLNHSCDPNLDLTTCFVGEKLPRLAFFTKKAVKKGQQITFQYNNSNHKQGMKCLCGSSNCKKII